MRPSRKENASTKKEDLEQISKKLDDERNELLALASLLKFAPVLDTEGIALALAGQIAATARELQATTAQLELQLEKPNPLDGSPQTQ